VSRIKGESVEAVRDAVDMIDLVSGRTQLRKAGAEWRGRCPFHADRTPSFWVNPVEKVYYCFGCQAKGDAIGFVKETEGLDYPGALEWLAERYGVRLEYEEVSPQADRRRRERERLLQLLDSAAVFYERYLWEASEAGAARAYLDERGIGEAAARSFRLGYAPSGGDRVVRAALAKGFDHTELARAGLTSRRGGDRFQERMMFPLTDARGRVRGFGARQMPGGQPPKYLNTAEGPLFKKGDILYGLDRARSAIARAGAAVVVEGYTDVILLQQTGIENVVASMGTALTDSQVSELRRLCSTVLLAFDADAAGEEASLRGMELALRAGLAVRVVSLPGGRDPADVAGEGPGAFPAALEGAEPYLTYRVRRALEHPGTRDERYDRARSLLTRAAPSVERDELVRLVADRLELTDDLTAALVANGRTVARSGARRPSRMTPRERDELLFLGFCLQYPDVGIDLIDKLDVAHFTSASQWEAAEYIRRRGTGTITAEEAASWAPTIAELTAMASREAGSVAVLEELFWKLRLRRTQDELKALDENADLSLSQQDRLRELQALRLSILERIRSQSSQE
jgi:DNA primase